MTRYVLALTAATAAFVATTGVAHAFDPASGASDLIGPILQAVKDGNYLLAAMGSVILLVALTRRYVAPRVAFLGSEAGAALLTLVAAFAGSLAAMVTGAEFTWGMVKTALVIAFGAAGGYAALKTLVVVPLLRPLRDRAPAGLRVLLDAVLWVFDSPGGSTLSKAESAGDAAVSADPASGLPGADREIE